MMKTGKDLKTFNKRGVEDLISHGNWKALRNYDLRGTDLRFLGLFWKDSSMKADLSGMDLTGTDLSYASFCGYDFSHTDLRGASLRFSNLGKTDFSYADLRGTDLYNTGLAGVNLAGVIVDGSTKWYQMSCPEEGSFIGYKKAFDSCDFSCIVKLRIPAHALRSSATSEQCRCSEAEVLSITRPDGADAGISTAYSWYDPEFSYRIGEMVRADGFCPNRWEESVPGIHFFMNREDAVNCRF